MPNIKPVTGKSGSRDIRAWVVTDGRIGIENQARGLAEHLQRESTRPFTFKCHRLGEDAGFRRLPTSLQRLTKTKPKHFGLSGPYPDIMIGCGRQSIPALIALKRADPNCFTIYIQHPRLSLLHFDLVIAPEHDGLSGPNIIPMIGAPHRVTQERLEPARSDFAAELKPLGPKRACLLIGGNSKTHILSKTVHNHHIKAATTLLEQGYGLMISLSRRSPDFVRQAYKELAQTSPKVWTYDGQGDNPYFTFLANANAVLVTEDSTNMLVEACVASVPVYRLPMQAHKSGKTKFTQLYQRLETEYDVTLFNGHIETNFTPPPLLESASVAKEVLARFSSKN